LNGNPLAEEPEYRPRVIVALPSVIIFDRHRINIDERLKSEIIVKEYNNPLIKNKAKKIKKLKVSEAFSVTEKALFEETKEILEKRKNDEIELMKKKEAIVLKREI